MLNDMLAVPEEEKTEKDKSLSDWIDLSLSLKLNKCGLKAQELLAI